MRPETLNRDRLGHSCGIIRINGIEHIIVIGGEPLAEKRDSKGNRIVLEEELGGNLRISLETDRLAINDLVEGSIEVKLSSMQKNLPV